MKMIVLDAMGEENNLSMTLKQMLMKNNDTTWFQLKDYKILPCRSCGSCAFISPGKCVIKDDFEILVKELVKSKVVIFLTSIQFGGYSAELKKVIDRLMVLGVPLYMVRKRHLLHPMRYDIEKLYGIGLSKSNSVTEEESFKKLVANNALNMTLSHKALTFRKQDHVSQIKNQLEQAFAEVRG